MVESLQRFAASRCINKLALSFLFQFELSFNFGWDDFGYRKCEDFVVDGEEECDPIVAVGSILYAPFFGLGIPSVTAADSCCNFLMGQTFPHLLIRDKSSARGGLREHFV
jgi:hypothetical protein